MAILSTGDLWVKASQWGSYMNSFDPGMCMYGFSENKGFQSEAHALSVIKYVEEHCLVIARARNNRREKEVDIAELNDIVETAKHYLSTIDTVSAQRVFP